MLIVDANVLFSFFLKGSKVRELVVDPKFEFKLVLVAPRLLLVELDKHRDEICEKAGISKEEYELPRSALEVFIKAISDDEWQDCKEEASKLLREHPKDIPYLALALKFSCPIWSNDANLKKQSKITVFSTAGLLKELKL